MKFDLIVIGSGPGGYVAAIRAAQLGLNVAVVEREQLGGICLNWGCIPTKALLRSAEVFETTRHAEDYGVLVDNVRFDTAAIVERSRRVSSRLSGGVAGLLKKNRVSVIWGDALLGAPGLLRVSEGRPVRGRPRAIAPADALGAGEYTADHIIVATGARPRILPGLEPDGESIWTYAEAMIPRRIPKSLLIVGSGAIGVEFASFYRSLGAEVTVIELLDQILPSEDAEISAFVGRQFEKQGITIKTGSKTSAISRNSNGDIAATIERGDRSDILSAERLIVAAGVKGNIEGLGLEALGVRPVNGFIAVDAFGRTNIAGLYAIGDVAGPPMLAHKAEHEGVVCVEAIKGLSPRPIDKGRVPACTYSRPQVASVGLTESRALALGLDVRVGRFPFTGNGKAIALGEDQGMVKTIFEAGSGKLLGAHMAGAEVTEMIQGFVIAMGLETTEEELMHAVFPHPTLSEMMQESVLDAYGRAIHK
jgi:dihydrolipoamide dehydrogenase